MNRWSFVPRGAGEIREEGAGVSAEVLVGRHTGSVHTEIALVDLTPGTELAGSVHPFEESFYVLGGAGIVTIGTASYRVTADDFGLVRVGEPHAWSNPGPETLRLFRVRTPQPHELGGVSYPSERASPAADGTAPPRAVAAPHRPVGHFDLTQLPAPGPLNMKGYRGPRIAGVSVWMLVDELVGAMHHTMFIVQFAPGSDRQQAGDHYHPFEEAYYFLAGAATAHLDGENVDVAAGDIVFCGVNALHGYTVTTDVPIRWIEIQAPAPPPHGATFFPADWQSDIDGLGR